MTEEPLATVHSQRRLPAEQPGAIPPSLRQTFWNRVWHVAGTTAAVGALAGLGEVFWAYACTWLTHDSRAILPASARGLLRFFGIALVTDALLFTVCGALAWVGLSAAKRLLRRQRSAAVHPSRALSVCLAFGFVYLLVGWVERDVLMPGCVSKLMYALCIAGTGACALVLSMAVAAVLNRIRRRWGNRTNRVAWAVTAMALVGATLPAFLSYAKFATVEYELPRPGMGPRPNILLVTLDTLRADYLGCYGNKLIDTPNLDALAAEGVLFEWAISQAPYTAPSHCSIMTGVYPPEHESSNGRPMRRDLPTLALILDECGYETVAFTASITTSSVTTGLHRGFQTYIDSLVPWLALLSRDEFERLLVMHLADISQHLEVRGEVVTDRAIRWLASRDDGPFFAWLHYFDPHKPYAAPEPYGSMYDGAIADNLPIADVRECYMGEIAYTDFQLGKVIAALKDRGLYENTLIIVTADHGEAFLEQHWLYTESTHGKHLYDTTQHVPLLVKPLNRDAGGRRVGTQVELVDIFPTILELLAIEPIPGLRGRSLLGAVAESEAAISELPAHSFNVVDSLSGTADERASKSFHQSAVRTSSWKYIHIPGLAQEELYDLQRDPRECNNRAETYPDVCGRKRDHLEQFITPDEEPPAQTEEIAPSLVRQLRNLGYLGGAGTTESEDTQDRE